MTNQYFVYILASHSADPVLYIGITNNLERRIFEHRNSRQKSFPTRYHCDKLVYFEITEDVNSALAREKQLKAWHRPWKLSLIKEKNPSLVDLSRQLFSHPELVSGTLNQEMPNQVRHDNGGVK